MEIEQFRIEIKTSIGHFREKGGYIMKEEMQKKLFCKIVLVIFFVAECTFKVIESGNLFSQKLHSNSFSPV